MSKIIDQSQTKPTILIFEAQISHIFLVKKFVFLTELIFLCI